MSETSNPQPGPSRPPEEFHWAVTYLREDIQDIRNEIRGVHGRIDETNRSLSERIDEKYELLAKRLDTRFALMMTTMVALVGVMVAVIKL
jgi:hypothetical protein